MTNTMTNAPSTISNSKPLLTSIKRNTPPINYEKISGVSFNLNGLFTTFYLVDTFMSTIFMKQSGTNLTIFDNA